MTQVLQLQAGLTGNRAMTFTYHSADQVLTRSVCNGPFETGD